MDIERKATIYSSQKATSKKKKKKNDDNEVKREEPKGDEYIVSPYLRQMVENL